MRNLPIIAAGPLLVVAQLLSILYAQNSAEVVPLPRAHAHNDYQHDRPLLDARARGFCSVEADIFLVNGELLVGHDRSELRPGRSLQKLYLEPLRELARQHGGRIYPHGPTITLLIDIKENGRQVYAALREVLAEYPQTLSRVEDGASQERAVQVVISGDRPQAEITADAIRYAAIDGRLDDLDSDLPAHLLPLISDRWTLHFTWRGDGEFPPAEREKLHALVKQAHAAGRRVRFWATPENAEVWTELVTAGVDHINTDRLDDLRDFLLTQSQK